MIILIPILELKKLSFREIMIYLETQLRVRVRLDKAGSFLSIRHTGSQKVVLHPAPLRPSGGPWSANSASFLSNNNICSFASQFPCQMQSWAETALDFSCFWWAHGQGTLSLWASLFTSVLTKDWGPARSESARVGTFPVLWALPRWTGGPDCCEEDGSCECFLLSCGVELCW